MKKFAFLLSVLAAMFVGSIIGVANDINPIQSAGISLVVGVVVSSLIPQGSLASGISVADLNTQLGAYFRKYSSEIWRAITKDLQFESYMTKVSGVTDEYAIPSSSATELLQPWQPDFTKKGAVNFDAYINKVRRIKMDYTLTADDIDKISRSYTSFLYEEGKKSSEMPIVKYIIENHFINKIREEIDAMSGKGVYDAPTALTAGASIDSVDGILTKIAAEITASNITPIVTGAIGSSDALTKTEVFHDALPSKYRSMPGVIFMSATNALYYQRNYRTAFGGTNDQLAKGNLKLDGTKKEIVGLDCFEGSDRILFTPKENLLCMYDKVYTPSTFEVEAEKRNVNIFTDFHRGYGFGNLGEVFVNDQA